MVLKRRQRGGGGGRGAAVAAPDEPCAESYAAALGHESEFLQAAASWPVRPRRGRAAFEVTAEHAGVPSGVSRPATSVREVIEKKKRDD